MKLKFRIKIDAIQDTSRDTDLIIYSQIFELDTEKLLKPKLTWTYISYVVELVGKIVTFIKQCLQKD